MVINCWPQISAGRTAWEKLRAFMVDKEARVSYTKIETPQGELSVEEIFQPNPINRTKPPILAKLSFRLEAGKSVAVIGPSGSGKSTLARMIVGAVKPFSGDIRIDGYNIKNWDSDELGRHVGYLAQDVELLPGTVAQNIGRFRPDANDADIRAAAAIAHVEDLIKKMPQGYDTLIGPGGVTISGGEKQRIALARAFFGMPKILILDEPNSSLDRIGESALLKALIEAKKYRMTVFLITQRESVVNVVDKLMRIHDGQIVDYGDRDQVIKVHSERTKQVSSPQSHDKAKPAFSRAV